MTHELDEAAPPIRWQWLPPALALLALLLLLGVPYGLNARVKQLRIELVAGSEHSRVLLNDLEAGFASQLLIHKSAQPLTAPPVSPGQMDSDAIALHAAAGHMGPQATALEYDLAGRLAAWQMVRPDQSAASVQDGLDLLASAERLDSYLTARADTQRMEAERIERYYVIAPALLAPVAAMAIVLIVLSARRERRFARIAKAERAQVVIASEARAALLRGVTHDVKNPLGAAAGYAQLLEEGIAGDLGPKQLEMVTRIHALMRTAVQTVTDLLELSHADGELHIEYTTSEIAPLVRAVVEDHEGMAQERQVTLSVTAPSTTLVTDPVRFRQILANLLTNAIKYTPAGGRVTVSIVSTEIGAGKPRRVGVEVRDNGPGIPPELHSRVFEEFFRVRSTGTAVGGNGLGLAISRRIARLMGGDVTFADAEGGGAVFTLWLARRGDGVG